MKVYLLRHGETAFNREKRYQGDLDIPLSPEGREALRPADFSPERVYVSPLSRAVESAEVLFPGARILPVPELREMSFGVFQGRRYEQMERDPDFLAAAGPDGMGALPGGESRRAFIQRTCAAFSALMDQAQSVGEDLVILAHGGTQMAILERYGLPRREYCGWCAPNGGGFLLDGGRWQSEKRLILLREVRYSR